MKKARGAAKKATVVRTVNMIEERVMKINLRQKEPG